MPRPLHSGIVGLRRRAANPTYIFLPCHSRGCRRFFSVKTGTVMHCSKIGCQSWLIAIHRVLASPEGKHGEGVLGLDRELGITPKAARRADTSDSSRFGHGLRGRSGGALSTASMTRSMARFDGST